MKEKVLKTLHIFGFFTTSYVIVFSALLDGNASSSQSKKITNFIYRLINRRSIKNNSFHKLDRANIFIEIPSNFEYLLRKSLGHFLLFFVLSYFTTIMLALYKNKVRNIYKISLSYGLLMAILGEILQLIPAHRGPSIKDVCLNFAGYISFLILYSSITLINVLRNGINNINHKQILK